MSQFTENTTFNEAQENFIQLMQEALKHIKRSQFCSFDTEVTYDIDVAMGEIKLTILLENKERVVTFKASDTNYVTLRKVDRVCEDEYGYLLKSEAEIDISFNVLKEYIDDLVVVW